MGAGPSVGVALTARLIFETYTPFEVTAPQCAAPPLKGKRVCKTHGGRSTGPKSEAGRLRSAKAKTIHGRETREARTERSLASARLAVFEQAGHELGFMGGTRTRGIKPHKMGQVLPELQAAIRRLR